MSTRNERLDAEHAVATPDTQAWLDERKRQETARKAARRALRVHAYAVMPRPNCAECGKPLKLYAYAKIDRGDFYGYEGNNVFCTAQCGFAFALACHRAGYRRRPS